MTCCSPFSPAATTVLADPTRHVNFTTGMVLGVDDYRTEFAYHAVRAMWIMREARGSGTLAGLAVSAELEDAGAPRVRVGAGSAAAPSGQLICVDRDQCGSLNAWLARKEVADQVTALANKLVPNTKARLNVWLTLCYTDCAVAPVPIPGQPCRSEDDLMAPSRVADDYVIELSLAPPRHSEARALALYDLFIAGWTDDTASTTALNDLVQRLKVQVDALFGPAGTPPSSADLQPLKLHPDQRADLLRAARRLWITRVRPLVMAQACAGDPRGEDCVLLARLRVPVVNPGGHWEVDDLGGAVLDAVDIDESERQFIESPALAASKFGSAAVPAVAPGTYSLVEAAGNLGAGTAAALVLLAADASITLAGGTGSGSARWVWLRNVGTGKAKLKVSGSGTIGGEPELELVTGQTALLVADGGGSWTRADTDGAP